MPEEENLWVGENADLGKEAKLVVRLDPAQPMELGEYADHLSAVGAEYQRCLEEHTSVHLSKDVRLHVTKVSGGSIITELMPLVPLALPLIEHANSVIAFSKSLKDTMEWLAAGELRDKADREQVENVSKIVKPCVHDDGSAMSIDASVFHNSVVVQNLTINLPAPRARAIYEGAERELHFLGRRRGGEYEKVVLRFYQARNDAKSKAGDRAIVESIYPSPVRAIFVNDGVKALMLSGQRNIFQQAFLVDLWVETVRDKPVMYRITNYHETLKL